jgi:hypothetical protein
MCPTRPAVCSRCQSQSPRSDSSFMPVVLVSALLPLPQSVHIASRGRLGSTPLALHYNIICRDHSLPRLGEGFSTELLRNPHTFMDEQPFSPDPPQIYRRIVADICCSSSCHLNFPSYTTEPLLKESFCSHQRRPVSKKPPSSTNLAKRQ